MSDGYLTPLEQVPYATVGFHIAFTNSTEYELLLYRLVIYIWEITTQFNMENIFFVLKSLSILA